MLLTLQNMLMGFWYQWSRIINPSGNSFHLNQICMCIHSSGVLLHKLAHQTHRFLYCMQVCLKHLLYFQNPYCTMLVHYLLRYHNQQVQFLLVHKNHILKMFKQNSKHSIALGLFPILTIMYSNLNMYIISIVFSRTYFTWSWKFESF